MNSITSCFWFWTKHFLSLSFIFARANFKMRSYSPGTQVSVAPNGNHAPLVHGECSPQHNTQWAEFICPLHFPPLSLKGNRNANSLTLQKRCVLQFLATKEICALTELVFPEPSSLNESGIHSACCRAEGDLGTAVHVKNQDSKDGTVHAEGCHTSSLQGQKGQRTCHKRQVNKKVEQMSCS